MVENADNFFENNLFRFENSPCDCVVDTRNIAPGQSPETTSRCNQYREIKYILPLHLRKVLYASGRKAL